MSKKKEEIQLLVNLKLIDSSELENGFHAVQTTDLEAFDLIYPKLVTLLFQDIPEPLQDIVPRLKQVCDYNVPHGKKNRGMTVVDTVRILKGDSCTSIDILYAKIVGWLIEWLQAYFLVADDIMDNSEMRRGQPCWYKTENIGTVAINDAFYLESCIYKLLRIIFSKKPYYGQLMHLFHSITEKTVLGQAMDLFTAPVSHYVDLSTYTEKRYDTIVIWKTAYYSFYFPVAAALALVGVTLDDGMHGDLENILLEMGHFFQVQDDFLDCFGDEKLIGKIGTDIQENKCSWLIAQALLKATTEEKEALQQNYGKWDSESVERVKSIYEKLNLKQEFDKHREKSLQKLNKRLDQPLALFRIVPTTVLQAYITKIFKVQ